MGGTFWVWMPQIKPSTFSECYSNPLALPDLLLYFLVPALSSALISAPCSICHWSTCYLPNLLCATCAICATGSPLLIQKILSGTIVGETIIIAHCLLPPPLPGGSHESVLGSLIFPYSYLRLHWPHFGKVHESPSAPGAQQTTARPL